MIPPRAIRGQTLTVDMWNALIEAIRRVRPLPGAGVSTRESPDGTFISAATQKQSPAAPFDHRFKVSFAKNKDGGYDLAIRKGSLWRVTGGIAAEQTLTLGEGLAEHPTDTDAWQIADATAGSLYVSQSTADDGETPVYTLDYVAAPADPAAVIADFTPSESSSNPTPKITQRHLGDLILFEGGAATGGEIPAAWMIRRHAFTETNTSGEEITTHKWQVFSPLWCAGRQTLLPEGMARGWNDLPDDADSGTLYAALTWVGTATADADGSETVSWAPGKPILTTSLADIPEDAAADPYGGGCRSVIVEIGDFEDAGDAEDAPTGAFRQAHLGVIVENLAQGGGGGGVSPTPEERDPVFLEVRKRLFGGAECWCVYLGNVVLNGAFPKKETDAAPWEWTTEVAEVARIGETDAEGWVSLGGGATEAATDVYYLRFSYYPSSASTTIPNGFSIDRGSKGDTPLVPELEWDGSSYWVNIPFAVGDGYGGLTNIHHGIPTFQIGSVGQSGAVLKKANASSFPWEKFVSVEISSAYQMALVEWAGLTVTIGYGEPGASGQSAQYKLPFDEALIASFHVDCVSHAEDHLFGIV